jgi:glutaredoxin-related protein
MVKPNPVIKVAANVMSLLKPIFGLEATLQAAILGAVTNVNKDEVVAEIENLKRTNPVLIYTYALSPFSAEACVLLDGANVKYQKVELGLEWFLLGGKASETRVALSKEVQNGATSLPKIFIGGECIGGCAELAELVESGALTEMLKRAKKVGTMKNSVFG